MYDMWDELRKKPLDGQVLKIESSDENDEEMQTIQLHYLEKGLTAELCTLIKDSKGEYNPTYDIFQLQFRGFLSKQGDNLVEHYPASGTTF